MRENVDSFGEVEVEARHGPQSSNLFALFSLVIENFQLGTFEFWNPTLFSLQYVNGTSGGR